MSEYKYDAFISYRHLKPDSFVAENVHKLLENYKIPKKLQKSLGRKRINDTTMAAAYAQAGVSKIITANPDDFEILNTFELITYGEKL